MLEFGSEKESENKNVLLTLTLKIISTNILGKNGEVLGFDGIRLYFG